MPSACSFDSIYVNPSSIPAGLGSGGSITATLWKNNLVTALAATGNSTAPSAGNLTGAAVAVAAGDLIAINATGAGVTSGQGMIRVSVHCQ